MYHRGSRSLQNLVAVSQRYCQPLLTIKAGCIKSNGKNWLLNPESSSQSEGYNSKWLIWLLVREPLYQTLNTGATCNFLAYMYLHCSCVLHTCRYVHTSSSASPLCTEVHEGSGFTWWMVAEPKSHSLITPSDVRRRFST